ncbi:MAG: Ppx/GppA family phosphatase [Clostridia bacterium]|nr:Ppx/GppA family phosphatase [Clostridia bacterium]
MERIGVIDLGSNTARLVIYEVLEGGYFSTLNEVREGVRLGETEQDGSLKATRVLQAISTVKTFKRICAINKVDNIIAVATAAVRTARNQRTFLNEMFISTGVKFRVLSQEEEANLIYQGVINSMSVPKGLIMEIGGGSTKFIYYNRRNILNTLVLPIGAVTLTEKFFTEEKTPEECSLDMENYFKEQLSQHEWFKDIDPDTQLIGLGGTFRNLSKIIRKITKYPLDMTHNYNVEVSNVYSLYDNIKGLDVKQRQKIKGLSMIRADVFPSALSAVKAFLDYMNFDKIITCCSGLREGIMYNYAVPSTLEKPINDVLGHSLLTSVNHLGCDPAHAEHVFNLSMQLFKQLRVLHKFPRSYLKVLRVAAYLCDTGSVIKFYNNPKHTAYYILNSNTNGVSHKDLIMAAYMTDYYNKEDNTWNDWAKYKEHDIINEEDVAAIKKLAVILKLAVALDAGHVGAVTEINCDVLGDSVIMKTEVEGDASLEKKFASSVILDFRRIYHKNLEII